MKKFYLLSTCLSLLLTCLILPNVNSQELVVGTLKNGEPMVSSIANATQALKGGLSEKSSIADIYIDREPSTGKYYLIGTVRNETISGKAIELILEGNLLRAVPGGPGIEITCTGVNCSVCVPVVKNWKARCECQDNPARPNSECNMTSKIIITPW